MPDGFFETPVRGKLRHNASVPADEAVAGLVALATNGDPAFTEGSLVHLSTDLAGNLRVVLGSEAENGPLDVDVTDRQNRIVGMVRTDADTRTAEDTRIAALRDALLAGLESVSLNADTRDDLVTRLSTNLESVDLNAATLTAITTALESVSLNADTRDDLVTRLLAGIEATGATTRTALESVDLNDATRTFLTEQTQRLRVRGSEVGDDNPLPVVVQTNPGALVDSGLITSANLAPGATVDLASAAVTGALGRLAEITAASSVRIKVELRTGATPRRVFFVDPTAASLVYRAADRDAITAATGATFTLRITNMDNLRSADVYGSITHVEG